MILKIASGNHLHSQYVDTSTGLPVYAIITRSFHTKMPHTSPLVANTPRRGSDSSSTSSATAAASPSPSQEGFNKVVWLYPLDTFADGTPIPIEEGNLKHTWILDGQENVIAELIFAGPTPTAIKIGSNGPILGRFCSTELFPRSYDRGDEFRAGTRIDDLEWVVTKSSLELVTSDEEAVMTYHTNARVDETGKLRPALLKGAAYLAVVNHDSLTDLSEPEVAELLVTFCLMEIIRRGRFKLTPYVFDANTVFDRYHAIIRDKYVGAASWRLRQMFGRARSQTL